MAARSRMKVAHASLSSYGWRKAAVRMASRAAMMPPGLQNALDLRQDGRRVRHVHEHGVAVGNVEIAVLEGEFGRVANVERGVGVAAGLGGGAGKLHLRLLHVDAVKLPGIDSAGKTNGDGARSAPKVQDAVARLQVRKQVGCVSLGAALLQHLPELLAVSHRVAAFRRLSDHWPCSFSHEVSTSHCSAAGWGRPSSWKKRGVIQAHVLDNPCASLSKIRVASRARARI